MSKAWHTGSEFKRRLAKLPASVLKKTNEAIEKNADEWVRTSKSMAPEDPDDGIHLKPSIRHYQSDTGGQIVRAGGEDTTVDDYDYAMGQEFGTAPHGAGGMFKGAQIPKMQASPFFWPAYRLLRKRMASRRKRAMNQAIKDFNNGK